MEDEVLALREAAMSGRVGELERLRTAGADLGLEFGGWSLLHSAAWAGQLGAASYLLGLGLPPALPDLAGSTPLHLAARQGHLEMVELLAKAEPGALDLPGANGSRPLHLAARRGHLEVARCLLARGARVDVADGLGRTPLDWARRRGHAALAGLIADHSAQRQSPAGVEAGARIQLSVQPESKTH